MKVLHIIPSVGPLRGGPAVVARTIATGLVSHGVVVDVVTTDDNGEERLRVPLGCPVVADGVTYWYFRRQLDFYTASFPLSQWLAAHVDKYDLVHIHALFSFAPTAGAFWAARRGVPYLVRPLGVLNAWGMRHRRPLLKRISLRLIERRILANAVAAHFTSEQERCEADMVAPGTRSVVVPNPVANLGAERKPRTAEYSTKYPQLTGKKVVLFLSRIDPIKGLDLLLDGFARARVALPDAALVVAGNGDNCFFARLREQARRLGIEQDIIWAGFVEGTEKEALLAAADVFVLPSYSENFGIAIVEAMARGLPVIVSDKVGIHQEVTRAGAGLVVSCTAIEVERAVIQMLSNQALRDEMARNAHRLAQDYSPTTVTARLLEVYRSFARGCCSVSSKDCPDFGT